ncbi:MAG: single-stranded-DNA-specific exonuclease RecJ [Candidatus Omnitrophica bacterium]|nr:single-stranded-DNA-specific exonuclease RecJ [Candidatus Omnitrophota bacterium]
MTTKRWVTPPPDEQKQLLFSRELGLSPVTAQVLINRGIDDAAAAAAFLACRTADLIDPFRLTGMREAVARIRAAMSGGETIVIYGDYDVDGLTATALLARLFTGQGARVRTYIPHRVEEGYGLNIQACSRLRREGASLLITVDCGISAFAEIAACRAEGLDVIVTDHHRPAEQRVPDALAVINPLQPGCEYPYKHLAGVGLAFKVAEAVCGAAAAAEYLDLVALGTISDVAPLTGENRILVRSGLRALSVAAKTGLRALMDIAGIRDQELTCRHVAFMIGPRLNATGRMGSAERALRLLLSDDPAESLGLAQELDKENRERQRLEAKTLREALEMIEAGVNFTQSRSVVLHHEQWHPGVIGIVASRIAERYNRPTILISSAEQIAKGSGRSIRNFHLFDALAQCGHLLEGFGGHEKAAGLTIDKENLADFQQAFNETASNILAPHDLIPVIDADMEIPLGVLSESLLADLDRCAPFGVGNPRPVFISRGVRRKDRPRPAGPGGSIKLWLTDGRATCAAYTDRFSSLECPAAQAECAIIYTPSLNVRQGITTIQLQLKDLHFAPAE